MSPSTSPFDHETEQPTSTETPTTAAQPVPCRVVVGADVGGTSARVVIAEADGAAQELHRFTGPGANLRSSGPAALDALIDTLATALRETADRLGTPLEIASLMLGIAGAGPARHDEVTDHLTASCAQAGITPEVITVSGDHLTAFLGGGIGENGILLLAGTGAVAVAVREGKPAERIDGMGWLLGDIGSAVWLGRRTLGAVAADIDGRGPRTLLTERLGDMLDLDLRDGILPPSPTGDPRQDLIRALDEIAPASSPAALGRFAPLPGTVPEDPVARGILDTAIRHLMDCVHRLDPEALALPVVLAGSVLATAGPIHDEIVTGLEAEGREVAVSRDGLDGALLLARKAMR